MNRRGVLTASLVAVSAGFGTSHARDAILSSRPPEKIRLIPDGWHIDHVGRLSDSRLYFVASQLDSDGHNTRDFVCTFLFDADGTLVNHNIELVGARGSYPEGSVGAALERHLAALEGPTQTDIWVRLFSVTSDGAEFGLIPRETGGGDWLVEFLPGNTLAFYAPWEDGAYDT
jgi:hypothetical protein